MERKELRCLLLIIGILTGILAAADGATNQQDVAALTNLYSSLNSPPQLSGWSMNGGDPCGQSWKGISCSGSRVTTIKLSGLGLTGSMGYQLSSLSSLTILDLSNNNIQNSIPYQLPPNVQQINLSGNGLSGTLPYSISTITALNYLNVNHNQLSGKIADVFGQLSSLSVLDLSFNNIAEDLPQSFSSLSNLNSLYLQNNQLTGSVNVLAGLSLTDLNIENNHFTGWFPNELKSTRNLEINGNAFNSGPAPPPPPYTPPPPNSRRGSPHKSPSESSSGGSGDRDSSKSLAGGAVAGIVIGVLFAAVASVFVILFLRRRSPRRGQDEEKLNKSAQDEEMFNSGVFFSPPPIAAKESSEQKIRPPAPEMTLKPPPSERHKSAGDKGFGSIFSSKRVKTPITATEYSIADLQMTTNSFSQENLIGEGAFGRVYRAEFPSGEIFAVKKIDTSAVPLRKPEDFLEAVSNMSRIRHSNIAELVGYCIEHGQHLLVYDYFRSGALHDILHMADENSKRLTWNTRVRIALGTARALEYLHEVCLPSVVHRNLKSANILLDDELNPHLSDCGLAALNTSSDCQVATQMLGSFGYSAPEYAMSGTYTVKSDVYSFGVVMLELLTGRKPLDSSRSRSEQSLVRWATPQLHDIDALAKMADPALRGLYPAKSLSRFADIIALCVQPEPEFRPPMSEVVQALVRLVQRASFNKKASGNELGGSHRTSDHDTSDPWI